ncbi:hypothetical protein D9M71_465000 [compost metagenome]
MAIGKGDLRIDRAERRGVVHEYLIAGHAKNSPSGHGCCWNDEEHFAEMMASNFDHLLDRFDYPARGGKDNTDPAIHLLRRYLNLKGWVSCLL